MRQAAARHHRGYLHLRLAFSILAVAAAGRTLFRSPEDRTGSPLKAMPFVVASLVLGVTTLPFTSQPVSVPPAMNVASAQNAGAAVPRDNDTHAALGADAALILGHWELEREKDRPGGIFTLVVRRFPEGWRIVHDHTSTVPPPAAAKP